MALQGWITADRKHFYDTIEHANAYDRWCSDCDALMDWADGQSFYGMTPNDLYISLIGDAKKLSDILILVATEPKEGRIA